MGNMGYCRFRNTLPDLRDCYENMYAHEEEKTELDPEEARARKGIIKICRMIVEDADFNGE